MIGAPGAGKSTWRRENRNLLAANHYDVDSVARELGGYNDPQAREQAYVDVALAIDNHVAQKENISIETLYSGMFGDNYPCRLTTTIFAGLCE